MRKIVLSDFDGTIISEDSALLILDRYGEGDWRKYDEQLLKGMISLEECLTKQFSTISIPHETIFDFLDEKIVFRQNFTDFAITCQKSDIPLVVVSAGLDFIIHHFMNKLEVNTPIPIVSAISKKHINGITFKFPTLKYKYSKNFKEDLVIDYQNKGYFVIYIGDGSGDFYAAKRADTTYAVEDSDLSRMCRDNGISFRSFLDFKSISLDLPLISE